MTRRLLLGGLGALWASHARAADEPLALQPLAPGLSWLPAAGSDDADPIHRGHVTALWVAAGGGRLWLIGSGPSPAFGRRLRQALQARWGRRPITVVSPWPHPETVLGVAGLGAVDHVAHTEVAQQMQQRCGRCVERLRARLGAAAGDLGDGDPARLPTRRLEGAAGTLGPWRWWRLQRADDVTVTVWCHVASGLVAAPGLLPAPGAVPDGREAGIERLAAATRALSTLPGLPRQPRWLGDRGGRQGADAPRAAAAYWQALQSAVQEGLARGDSGEIIPATLPGIAPTLASQPLHGLNWQRAWRQAEDRWLQRNLR